MNPVKGINLNIFLSYSTLQFYIKIIVFNFIIIYVIAMQRWNQYTKGLGSKLSVKFGSRFKVGCSPRHFNTEINKKTISNFKFATCKIYSDCKVFGFKLFVTTSCTTVYIFYSIHHF